MKNSIFLRFFVLALACAPACSSSAVTLEQIVSHENPAFNPVAARMVVGRDGMVYLYHARSLTESGYLLRLARDGSAKTGTLIAYSNSGVAANAAGTYVVAETHFAHAATTYDSEFKRIAAVTEFENSNYDAPQHVEAGASGDFYAADLRGKRIVRFTAAGKQVATYPVTTNEFRVDEPREAFYVSGGGNISCIGFDGAVRWKTPAAVGGDPWNGYYGGFDADDNGTLYIIDGRGEVVRIFDAQGKPGETITLAMGDLKPTPQYRISDLRVFGDDILVRRSTPTEVFQNYDAKTGARRTVVTTDHETLRAEFPDGAWTAGQSVPFRIEFAGTAASGPHWRVWARPFGAPGYRELALQGGALQVPPDAAGLYQIKVTPETAPQQRRAPSEYMVRTVVEIRQPNTKGTASVLTRDNRVWFGRGETIPVAVLVRAAAADRPASLTVRLTDGARTYAEGKAPTPPEGQAVRFFIPGHLTAALRPGAYSVTVAASGLTCVAQPIIIGTGTSTSPFRLTQYGDYGTDMPYNLNPFDAPDVTSFYAQRSAALGLNMLAERAGPGLLNWDNIGQAALDEVIARLNKDPQGVAPEKARPASPYQQTMAAYSAAGVSYMPILLGNDASTTLGVGFDARKPEKLVADITALSQGLAAFPAWRGWTWAANWWAADSGAASAKSPEQKKAYEAALARAKATGAWDPVLDDVSNIWLNRAADATQLFGDTLRKVAPDRTTAVSAPYRNAYAYPPITFRNVNEVDLHFQAEQMSVPYFAPHDVDYYKRPGKPAWAHPEIWNDNGTGDQILPTLFQMVMRGADGVGFSGGVGFTPQPEDSRQAYNGTSSIFRAANTVLREYGPWLATLRNNDHVAIIADGRMLRLDEWSNIWGTHFARLKEAYTSCLHAHYPASIVFTDDLKSETLARYKAVLIVGQRYEMEPALLAALQKAKAAGTAIFYDGTCRAELVKDYTPLGIAFDKFEKDPHTWGDDPAYAPYRFPGYVLANLPALQDKLGTVLRPLLKVENPEVLLSERVSGAGRFIFVVNNTTIDLDPGQMWRHGLFVSTRVPVKANLSFGNIKGQGVYDIFRRDVVHGQIMTVSSLFADETADMRTLPMRMYAILPAPIARVGLRSAQQAVPGRAINWAMWVQDAKGTAINATLPVRVRLLAADGTLLDERYGAANYTAGATGSFIAPLNAPPGALTLEATELCSGRQARLTIALTGAPRMETLPTQDTVSQLSLPGMNALAVGIGTTNEPPVETRFGPHIKDMVLLDGGTVLLNALNWDTNLYAFDSNSGKRQWEQRIGQGYAFAPQPVAGGLAVQGFDFQTPESYHLYLADAAGKPQRRFALYGLSRRLPQRFLASWFNDRMNNFATPRSAAWVASAGDLGIAVWSRDGQLLWQIDRYRETHNKPRFAGLSGWNSAYLMTPLLGVLSDDTLLALDGLTATAYNATSGAVRWRQTLATTGEPRKMLLAGNTCTILATTEGGRIYILRDGKLVRTIPAVGDDMALAPDGSRLVLTNSTQVKSYSLDKGLEWVFNGDEFLHNPRFAPDNQRMAVCSKLGVVYVLDASGNVLHRRDMGALAVPLWLPEGDLLLGTWMGTVLRLDGKYAERWRTRLQPAGGDMRGKILAPNTVPTARITGWGNADAEAAPLTPNLLATAGATVSMMMGRSRPLANTLFDGKPDAPAAPLVGWGDINWLGESGAHNWVQIDAPASRLKVDAITLVEDAAHPESWLRDAYLEYFDAAADKWVFVQSLLSDAPVHTHRLAAPVEASRFRIVLPPGLVGNLRLGEIVLHGSATAIAKPAP